MVSFEDNGDVIIYRGFLAEEATPEELANDPAGGELILEDQDGIPVARVDHESGILYIQGHAYPEQTSISESLGPTFEVQLTEGTIVAAITAAGDLYCLGEIIFPDDEYTLEVEEVGGGGTKAFVEQVELLSNKIGNVRSWQVGFGKRVTLKATPVVGSFFSSWIDANGDIGVLDEMPFRMTGDWALQAVFNQDSAAADWPDSIVAFGDSSSLAVLSSNLPWGVALGCVPDFEPPILDCWMQRIYNGQPKHSWSTGDAPFDGVRSHYERILMQNPAIRGKNYNMAISGASLYYGNAHDEIGETGVYVNGLRNQIQTFKSEYPSIDIDYATIWMGGMDVCGYWDILPSEYEQELEGALVYFRSLYSDAIVLLVQLPDIVAIYEEFHDYPGCQWEWTNFGITGFCPDVLGTDAEIRAAARQRNLDLNEAISDVVADLEDERIFVVEVDFETDVIEGRADVSLEDCFHPTMRVQQRLAEKAWDSARFEE
ncbi:MAG: hypothetical protein HYZ00_01845 [Candidatus Hydrogenedentes bacterium]|nr:hypothetical protein [Candidatus Hydrogenedentota bacterium]